jgi:hypothetical protein
VGAVLRKVVLLLAALLLLLLLLQPASTSISIVRCRLKLLQLVFHGNYLDLPVEASTIITQLQQALAWGVRRLSLAGRHRYADEATCARWSEQATDIICGSGALRRASAGASTPAAAAS